jgi:hypothetical protein
LIQKNFPVFGLAQGLGAHGSTSLHLLVSHDLLEVLKSSQGPGHALRGELSGGGQALPQTGDLASMNNHPEFAAGQGFCHRQAHRQTADIDGGEVSC